MKVFILTIILIITPGITYAGISHKTKVALRLHDHAKAFKLLKVQAVKNDAEAQYHLALLYRTGKGTKQSYKNAFYWFKKSADNGNIRAQYNCGILFENGYGVEANEKKALRWYKMAAKKGHRKSKEKLRSALTVKSNNRSNNPSALFKAIKNKKASTVKKLTEKCLNINKTNDDSDTALISSIKYGSYDTTKLILRCNPNLNIKDRAGNTPILIAANAKKHKTVHILTQKNKGSLNTPSRDGLTPLMKSALLNDLKSATYLLRKGAKINLKDKKGNTAYNFAEIKQHSKMMVLLKKHGAHQSKRNKRRIPSNIKIKSGQWPLLITAAWRGQNDVVESLLKKKINPNITDKNGNTALIRATERGHTKTVKLLLNHSALINKKNKKGLTPLMAATLKNNTKILDYLISKKAQINLRDKTGMTALMHTADAGNLNAFIKLLKNKAKKSYKDKKKRSLIKIAQDKNHQSIISYIIKNNIIHIKKSKMKELLLNAAANGEILTIKAISNKGMDLNITDKSGNTPLIISASKGFYKTSKFLLKNKANINAKNRHGNTALIFAAQTGKYKVVELLLKLNADPSIRNKNRKTALDLAKSNGYKKITKAISNSDKSGNFLGLF